MAGLLKVFRDKWNPPKPSTASFDGKTILLTAATGGLGLEAAKKLVAQGTSTLIITGRDEKKAAAAKAELEKFGSKTKIIPLSLEMSDPASMLAFVDALKKHVSYLDHTILNAGLIQVTYKTSSTGWEDTIQVNAISTILLSLLILPLLAASPLTKETDTQKRPHLVYVSSGTAWLVKPPSISKYMASSTPLQDFSAKSNFPSGTMGGQVQYGRSKYILEHCFRRVAALSYVQKQGIVVTSTCPGMCKSDLGRQFQDSFAKRWAVYLFMLLVARDGQDGANIYITSLEQGEEAHGEMWKDDMLLDKKPEVVTNMKTEEAVAFGDKIWKEMQEALRSMDQSGKIGEILVG